MNETEKLLLANKAWAEEVLEDDPEFFLNLAKQQKPRYLWIGCSDSRVPANQIIGLKPGEIFVHRNIANMVIHTDLNLLSVVHYAVDVLEVEEIIVCGHYGCGGVVAAMGNQNLGIINTWLRNIKDVYRMHEVEVNSIEDMQKRTNKMVELNVKEQVQNLAKTNILQKAWNERKAPLIHGWVYGLDSGLITELCKFGPEDKLDKIYEYDVD